MNNEQLNAPMAAVQAIVLTAFDNETLAILNNSIQTFGTVDPLCLAYKPSLDANLIKDNGAAFCLESLRDACAYEVNRRVELGIFK